MKLVEWVQYAGLPSHPDHALAQNTWAVNPHRLCALALKAAKPLAKFIDALQLFYRLVNIGDAKSLACHPATTTHRQLTEEEMAKAGVSLDLIACRLVLSIDDILFDLTQALDAAR